MTVVSSSSGSQRRLRRRHAWAESPGVRDVDPAELDGYFPELRHLVAGCQFSDCTHIHEPGCAVRAAVDHRRDPP
jgi:ribosome biogenesis GTPase